MYCHIATTLEKFPLNSAFLQEKEKGEPLKYREADPHSLFKEHAPKYLEEMTYVYVGELFEHQEDLD